MIRESPCVCWESKKGHLKLKCSLCQSASDQECYIGYEKPFKCFVCLARSLEPRYTLQVLSKPKLLKEDTHQKQKEALVFQIDKKRLLQKNDQVFAFILDKASGQSLFDGSQISITLSINGNFLNKGKQYGPRSGIPITEYLKDSSINQIQTEFPSSLLKNKNYVFFVVHGSYLKVDQVMKEVIHRSKNLSHLTSIEKFRDNARMNRKRAASLEEGEVVSIMDAFSSDPVVIPCRGIKCNHLRCFSLESYFSKNKCVLEPKRWICPICQQQVFWWGLYHDRVFQEVIEVISIESQYLVCVDFERLECHGEKPK